MKTTDKTILAGSKQDKLGAFLKEHSTYTETLTELKWLHDRGEEWKMAARLVCKAAHQVPERIFVKEGEDAPAISIEPGWSGSETALTCVVVGRDWLKKHSPILAEVA